MECPTPKRECPVDPVDLEHRLTSIEVKIDRISDKFNGNSKPPLGFAAGLTAGISAITTGIVYGLITYFKGDVK